MRVRVRSAVLYCDLRLLLRAGRVQRVVRVGSVQLEPCTPHSCGEVGAWCCGWVGWAGGERGGEVGGGAAWRRWGQGRAEEVGGGAWVGGGDKVWVEVVRPR